MPTLFDKNDKRTTRVGYRNNKKPILKWSESNKCMLNILREN